ncbi:SMP-30/gluconolactonase/LRE family protein [Nocardia sp. CA-290969]|uniref:SMP-30/gluconolactonase/LRE family protein n=1 Tax=Nocardia sp. CA-290969 TaxID=3239986 RepID=UPI003D90338F
MREHALEVFATGHQFLEAPRWHAGRLWASDFFAERVLRFDESGAAETVAEVAGSPSGLGFLADGSILVVSRLDAKVLRIDTAGALSEYADLSDIAGGPANDMLVTPSGHAYVGNFGFSAGDDPKPTSLAHIDPNRVVSRVEGDVGFPNGMALTDDNRLLVAETLTHRITAFDIAADGSLTRPHLWAQLPDTYQPDGIAYDTDRGVWFGNAMTVTADAGFYRVEEGGEITDKIPVAGAWAVACAFGGPHCSTLYLTCNATDEESFRNSSSAGYIATARVGRAGFASEHDPR